MASIVRMPEVLANASEAIVATWLVQKGQTVAVGVPLAEVETEKAVVEYAAETAGTILDLLVAEGKSVSVGDAIAVIGDPGESVDPELLPRSAPEPAAEPAPAAPPAAVPDTSSANGSRRLFASPLVRRLARDRGLDLATITGTGPNGRIVRRDLAALPEAVPEAAPEVAPKALPEPAPAPAPAEDEVMPRTTDFADVPVTGMRRAIARRLTESKSTVPHFYLAGDIRMDALLDLRRRLNDEGGLRISVNDLLVKAAAGAFSQVPEANATWTDTAVRRYESVDIAVAVAVDGGLVTPVLRGVERLSIGAVAAGAADLIGRARDGRLKQHELEGGCFTISNLGMYGVKEFSAIINPPQASILAVGGARPQPVAENGEIVIRSVMTVTLSSDHRVIDGALAARWMAAFVQRCENPMRILI